MRQGFLAAVLVLGAVAQAQAQAITSYRLDIYIQGAPSPTTSATLPAAGFTCGQPRITTPPTVANPTRVVIEDPANANLDCVYVDSGSGPLLALPFSPTTVYTASILATNSAGNSASVASANSFTRPGSAPNAPRQLRIGG